MSDQRYTTVAIVLHWVIALALIGLIIGGNFMSGLAHDLQTHKAMIGSIGYTGPDEAALRSMSGWVEWLYQFHKSAGITILILTIARITWRMLNPPPPLPSEMATLEKTASHLVHLGFYGVMIALPLTGWLYSSISTSLDVPTVLYGLISWPDLPFVDALKTDAASGFVNNIHGLLGWVTFALLALHVAGAVKHEISAEGGVLKRMIPGVFGTTSKPDRASGYKTAFGSAAAVFVAVAFVPPLYSSLTTKPIEIGGMTVDFTPNWTIDRGASSIQFSGTHDGKDFEGEFQSWDAAILFDQDQLDAAEASVVVQTGSAVVNDKLYTDSLKSSEWLDPSAFATATVQLSNFSKTGDGYSADAELTIKDVSVTVPFDFKLTTESGNTIMSGQTVLYRQPLDLGQASDPDADWVSEEIAISATVQASRVN